MVLMPDGLDFFGRPTLAVAADLIGTVLHVRQDGREMSGRIVETEAYLGAEDPASHAAAGPTSRCAVMFGPPAVAYVYLIYGVHHGLNFVTEPFGNAGAVLIRAVEPLCGRDLMAKRMGRERDLTNGPGKLCRAFGIDRRWNGLALNGSGEPALWVSARTGDAPRVETTARIGLRKAVAVPYRFCDGNSTHLSR